MRTIFAFRFRIFTGRITQTVLNGFADGQGESSAAAWNDVVERYRTLHPEWRLVLVSEARQYTPEDRIAEGRLRLQSLDRRAA